MKKWIITLIVVFFLAAGIIGYDFYNKVKTPYKGYEEPITINIMKGSSVSDIARLLYSHKIIANYYYFKIYYRLYFNKVSFKSGEYLFDQPMAMREVIRKLDEGKVRLYKITIKEGLTIEETAELLAQSRSMSYDDFVEKARDTSLIRTLDDKARDLEGYLFPDTYHIRKDTGAAEMVASMVEKFKEHFSNTMKMKADELGMSIREVVILASLIEKETSSREERFLISSVFHNRLRIGMALACDPTIIYILKKEQRYDGDIRWEDLEYDSPYNTRLHRGLPPGPICSPGYASIEAALFPENTKYLYFVAKDKKTHYFSKTLREHNRAVKKFILKKDK